MASGLLGTLNYIIGAKTTDLERGLKKSEGHVNSFSRNIQSGVTKAMTKVGGAIAAAFAVDRIVSFTKESVKLAAEAEGIKAAFDRLNQPNLLKDLRLAVQGTIDDVTLMKQAVRAQNFKVPLNQLATFFEFATKRAAQTGESVDYLVNSIIDGIGRKSTLVMDNLGISATELQDEIKKVGDFGQAAGNIIDRELGKMGEVALTSAQKFQQLQAQTKNLQVELGTALTPIINKLTEATLNAVNGLNLLLDSDYTKSMRGAERDIEQFRQSLIAVFSNENYTQAQNIEVAALALGKRLSKVNQELSKEKGTLEKLNSLRNVPQSDIKRHEDRIRVLQDTMSLYQQMYLEVLKGVGVIKEEAKAEETLTQTIEKGNRELEKRVELRQRQTEGLPPLPTQGNRLNTDASGLVENAGGFFDRMENMMVIGGMLQNIFDDMAADDPFKAMSESIKALIVQLAQAAALSLILSLLTGGISNFGKIFGGMTGFSIPKFAEGGITSGPTLAMVGDNPSGKEAIIPLEKMGQIFGGMQGGGMGGGRLTASVSGTDLKFILDRTNQNFNRFN
jgi:hypothetical protein